MDKRIYYRGLLGQAWYNFTEALALVATYRPTPKNIDTDKWSYGTKNINYIKTQCRNDLKDKKKPLFLYIHGGGWISGITKMRDPYIGNWAEKGFFTASIAYSYAPQEVFPTQIKEVFTAIDLICDKAEEMKIDLDNVVISGESAGGYYIAFVVACLNNPEILKKLNIEFRNIDKIKIRALVSHCGCFNPERLIDTTKPQSEFPDIKMMTSTFAGISLSKLREYLKTDDGKIMIPEITDKFPPCFLVWCAKDKLQHETFDLDKELTKLNVPHKLFKGDGKISAHAWSIVTMFPEAKECLKETFDYVLPYLPEYF